MNNHDKIEKYLKGQLSEDERAAFEKELSNNEALKKELNIQRFEEDLLDWALEDKLQEKIQSFENSKNSNSKGNSSGKILLWIIGILSFLALIYGAYNWLKPASSHETLKQYALTSYEKNPYEPIAPRTGDASEIQNNLESYEVIILEIRLNELNDVLNLADSAHLNVPNNLKVQNLLGHAYFLSGDYIQAISQFRLILESLPVDKKKEREDAEFYLALSLLAYGNERKAIEILTKISNSSINYGPAAKELLSHILPESG